MKDLPRKRGFAISAIDFFKTTRARLMVFVSNGFFSLQCSARLLHVRPGAVCVLCLSEWYDANGKPSPCVSQALFLQGSTSTRSSFYYQVRC